MFRLPGVLAAAALAAAPLGAQDLSGTYTTTNQQGAAVTLTLQQDAQGQVSGTLSGNGNTFQVQGRLQQGSAVGLITHPQIRGMYFQATAQGGQLVLVLVGIGADDQPDPSQREEIVFTRQTAMARGGGGGGGAGGGGADPWVGTWAGGNLTVSLEGGGGQYRGVATVQGNQFPITGQGSGTRLTGTYAYNGQSFGWQAELQGGTMVFHVDGQTVQLTRGGSVAQGGGAGVGTGPAAGGGGGGAQLSPQAREWHQWLAGKRLTQMDSYYSGPSYDGGVGGGYNDKKVMEVCSNGQFVYSGSSVVGAGGAGISGYSGGQQHQQGQWRIIEQGGQIGIEFRWQDGSVTQHLLEYRDNKTFIDGTRTFVTQDNQTCP